jgi:hypothetical protein
MIHRRLEGQPLPRVVPNTSRSARAIAFRGWLNLGILPLGGTHLVRPVRIGDHFTKISYSWHSPPPFQDTRQVPLRFVLGRLDLAALVAGVLQVKLAPCHQVSCSFRILHAISPSHRIESFHKKTLQDTCICPC